MTSERRKEESGYVLILIILFLALAGTAVAAVLVRDATFARTVASAKVRSEDFVDAEKAVGHVVSWLRLNSQKLAKPFRREDFYASWTKTAPAVGTNDMGTHSVPTKLKLAGTFKSAVLTNDSSLVTAAFAPTADLSTNIVYDAPGSFEQAELGPSLVRLTLLDAIPGDPAADYGPPPNPVPETDFYPVFRLDTMNAQDSGAHIYGTISANLVHRFDFGIYGESYLEIRQPCDSFHSSQGNYSMASREANCRAASYSKAAIHKNEEIFGTLKTNGSVTANPPYGGETCADFAPGCPNKGETCAGEDCGVPLLDQYYDWSVYCPRDAGDLVIDSATPTVLTLAGSAPEQRCFRSVTVKSNSTLVLRTTTTPYFFQTLTLVNNSNSTIDIQPNPAGKKVELFVVNITGNKFNGNQVVNSGRPTSFTLNYLGTNMLTLDGSAAMNVALVAANTGVTVSGNFEYKGSLLAKQLYLQGSGGIHYDEDLGGTGPVIDVQYRLKEVAQRYR